PPEARARRDADERSAGEDARDRRLSWVARRAGERVRDARRRGGIREERAAVIEGGPVHDLDVCLRGGASCERAENSCATRPFGCTAQPIHGPRPTNGRPGKKPTSTRDLVASVAASSVTRAPGAALVPSHKTYTTAGSLPS